MTQPATPRTRYRVPPARPQLPNKFSSTMPYLTVHTYTRVAAAKRSHDVGLPHVVPLSALHRVTRRPNRDASTW